MKELRYIWAWFCECWFSWFLSLALVFLSGCVNVSTTTYRFTDTNGATCAVEFPKELDAENLTVTINAREGTATIHADKIQSMNVATITAQGQRESKILGEVAEKAAKGAVSGLKGGVP